MSSKVSKRLLPCIESWLSKRLLPCIQIWISKWLLPWIRSGNEAVPDLCIML